VVDDDMSEHAHPNYVKVWAILVALLMVSITGPMVGIPLLTLMTAFGIAIVKAYLVAKNFMHLNIEKRFVVYLLGTVLAFMVLFYAGASPDVMQHEGTNWKKPKLIEEAHSPAVHRGSAHGETH
jgi:caa(3)-type oxidase subunit IV